MSKQCNCNKNICQKCKIPYYPPGGMPPFQETGFDPNLQEGIALANNIYSANYPQDVQETCPGFDPAVIIPSKHVALVTCMDARIIPNEIMGFCAGQWHVIRNAGGRVDEDVIRSLVISWKLLQTNQFIVMHHSDCGMMKFTQKVLDKLLKGSLVHANLLQNCNVDYHNPEPNSDCCWTNAPYDKCDGVKNRHIEWLDIPDGQLEASVIEDVAKIRNHKLIPPYIPIYGYIYDVFTGKLIPVEEANKIGQAGPLCCEK